MRLRLSCAILAWIPAFLTAAVDPRGFSGTWILDPQASNWSALSAAPAAQLKISRQDQTIQIREGDLTRSFDLEDGAARIDGSGLVIATPAGEDRWKLSDDGKILTVSRSIRKGDQLTTATLVYRNAATADPLPKQ